MRDIRGWGADPLLPSLCLAALLGGLAACAGPGGGGTGAGDAGDRAESAGVRAAEPREEYVIPDTTIIAAQEALTPTVMALPGVVGTAVGLCDDLPCIKVYLARRDEELRARIPQTFEGFKVDIEVSGDFEARDSSP